jgi:hypothetical protein
MVPFRSAPHMVFDNTCAVEHDADREELNVLAAS